VTEKTYHIFVILWPIKLIEVENQNNNKTRKASEAKLEKISFKSI